MDVIGILNMQKGALLDVIGTTKQNVNFFERYLLGFWDQEPDEGCKEDVDREEEEECFATDRVSQFVL